MTTIFKTIRNTAAIIMLFFAATTAAQAQQYGGSAYVHIKDDKGNTKVLNATVLCNYSTESLAKSNLKHSLTMQKKYNEEFDSQVYYSIDQCNDNDKKRYGGSASVKVSDDKGNTRVLSATALCYNSTKSLAKSNLKHSLTMQQKYNEEFITGISYDIDSCN